MIQAVMYLGDGNIMCKSCVVRTMCSIIWLKSGNKAVFTSNSVNEASWAESETVQCLEQKQIVYRLRKRLFAQTQTDPE